MLLIPIELCPAYLVHAVVLLEEDDGCFGGVIHGLVTARSLGLHFGKRHPVGGVSS
jgi:hypothetical protein